MPISWADAIHDEGNGVRAESNESGIPLPLASQRQCKPVSSKELMLRVEQEIADGYAAKLNR